MRKSLRAAIAVSITVILVATLAACPSKGHHTGSSGSGSNAQASKPDYFGCNANDEYLCSSSAPAGSSAPAPAPTLGGFLPVPTADAGPIPQPTAITSGGSDCNFYYGPDKSGIQVVKGQYILGITRVFCKVIPKYLSVLITIHELKVNKKNFEQVGGNTKAFPGSDLLVNPLPVQAPCEPGIVYLQEIATGIVGGPSGNGFSVQIIGEAVTIPGGPDGPCA